MSQRGSRGSISKAGEGRKTFRASKLSSSDFTVTFSAEICKKCELEVKDNENGVQCELCESWGHGKCYGVSEKGYEVLRLQEVMWVCQGCRPWVEDKLRVTRVEHKLMEMEIEQTKSKIVLDNFGQTLDKGIRDLKDLESQRKNDISMIEDKIKQLENNLNTKIEEVKSLVITDSLNREINNKELQTNVANNTIPLCTRRDILEEIELDKRKNNLILKGIQEGQNLDEIVKGVVFKLGGEAGVRAIRNVIRVGKMRDRFHRPVRVEFTGSEVKVSILRNAVNLAGTEFREIYLAPDLTPKQQMQDKLLRDKLKEIRTVEKLENIKIKKGNIIQKNPDGREVIIFPIPQV